MKPLYFLKGRTALKYGLKYLGLKKNDKLLVPAFICDVVIEELNQLNIKPVYYLINKNFEANWLDIKKKYTKDVKGILMVHFFGKPQKLDKFKKFTKQKKIYLIEDNCHGFNELKKIKLSGDISITSPYKIIDEINNGGILFIKKKKKVSNFIFDKPKQFNNSFFQNIRNKIKRIKFLKIVYRFFINRPNYESISINFSQEMKKDYLLDFDTVSKIHKFSLIQEKDLRIQRFNFWRKKMKKFKIQPYFNYTKNDNYILWYCVVKIDNYKIRQKVYNWGWKNNIDIISWPSFPKECGKNDLTYKFSRKFVLFPLNKDFNNDEKFKY